MVIVKNIGKDTRKFYAGKEGRWITLNPGESTEVKAPPMKSEYFEVLEETKAKKKDKLMEEDNNGSHSSR